MFPQVKIHISLGFNIVGNIWDFIVQKCYILSNLF